MRRPGKIALIGGAAALAAIAVWYAAGDQLLRLAGADGQSDRASEQRAVPVQAAQVRRGEILVTAETTGELRARDSVRLTTDARGLVRDVTFEEGERVTEGDVLVRLDSEEEQAELMAAQARRDEIALQLARARELAAEDFATEARVDELEAQLAEARAAVAVAEAHLAERTIEAPFTGWIGLRLVSEGALVTPGTAIARLWSIDPIDLGFRVPADLLPHLEVGQTVIARGPALPDGRIEGEVRVIEGAVDQATRTVALEAAFANPEGRLRPGTFVQVELVLERRDNALIVPEEALLLRGSKAYVYVVGEDAVVQRREVQVGERRRGEAEIVEGLSGEETIVVAGLQNVSDGQKVRPVSDPAIAPDRQPAEQPGGPSPRASS